MRNRPNPTRGSQRNPTRGNIKYSKSSHGSHIGIGEKTIKAQHKLSNKYGITTYDAKGNVHSTRGNSRRRRTTVQPTRHLAKFRHEENHRKIW